MQTIVELSRRVRLAAVLSIATMLALSLSLGRVGEEPAFAVGPGEADIVVLLADALDVPEKAVIGVSTDITLEAGFENVGPDKVLFFEFNLVVSHPPQLKITPDNTSIGGPEMQLFQAFFFPIDATLE